MALYDSYEIAKTIEVACISSINNGILTTDQIRQHAHTTLHRYDPVAALQYGAQHGMIMSARRQRGRPSTIATSDGDAARG
jgi:hypothetical protein